MAAKDNKALSELRRLTECCICLMPFTDPRMLPCIHSACLKCLQDLQTKNKTMSGAVIHCPVCRKGFTIPPTGMSGLQKNFFIANLLEITQNLNEETTFHRCKMCKIIDAQKDASEATMKCLECHETFCERCANIHKFTKSTQGHRAIAWKENPSKENIPMEVLPPPKCKIHPLQVLNYYCGDCTKVVCVSCFVEKHKLHDCKDVTTVDKNFRKSLENSSTRMLHYIPQMEEKRSKMESKRLNLLEQTSEIENAVRLKNQQLKAMIDEHTQVVLNELSSIKQRHLKNLETEVEEIERKMAILKSFESYCSEMKSKGSPTDICSSADELIRRSDHLERENAEYLTRPDSTIEIKFNAAEQDVFIRRLNVIGQIEASFVTRTALFHDQSSRLRSLRRDAATCLPKQDPIRRAFEATPYGRMKAASSLNSTETGKSYAIVLGGYNDGTSVFEDVSKINLHRNDDVSYLQSMPTQMQIESASVVYSNAIYITGLGSNEDEIWRFDVMSNAWQNCASMTKGRRRHSVAFVDHSLYICGGYVESNRSVLYDVEAYDAIKDRCSSVGKLVHCVQNSGNCVPFESSLYIFGGANANYMAMNQVQVYDTKSNTCTLLSQSMPIAYGLMRAALFEKTVILLGKDNCLLYGLATGTWQERRQFKTGNYQFGMIIENNQIFVFGGGTDTTDAEGKVKWTCRDDVRCIPLKNIIEDKAFEWRHHAKLSRSSLVFSCEKSASKLSHSRNIEN